MDKIRRDKRKEVHPRLDFGKNPRKSRRVRESSQNSSAGTLPARYRNPSERPKMRNRLKYNDEDVFDRLSHRRQSAFDRLSNTYSLSTTKSGPNEGNSRDRSHSRGRSRTSSRDRPRNRNRPRGIKESYGNTRSSYRAGDRHGYHARDRDRSRSMKRGRKSESPLSRVSKSDTSDGGHWKTRAKKHKPADEEDLSVPWTCEDVDPFTPRIRNFKRAARVWFDELPPESIDGYKGLKAAFLAYFMQQKKYVKDPVEIHNIKQRDGKTIKEFIKRFKIETERMKGAPECIKFTLLRSHRTSPNGTPLSGDLNQPKDGRGSNKFTPLTITPKEIFAAESGKFKPPSPIVEKRSSNKFCEFHNDKGHSTDECVQLKKQIEELVRAGKLSHFIKEIRQDRDQQKTRKKDAPVKDKSAVIYMIWPWQRVTRQKVTQSSTHVKEITFPPLTANKGTEGPLVIEAKIGGHVVHHIYVDEGSSMELKFLVTIRDAEHYTKAWMNFMIVRSPSPYNGIFGRLEVREIQAVPSTAYGMLKFPVNGEIVTICSTILTPTECATIAATPKDSAKKTKARHENFKWPYTLTFWTKRLLLEECRRNVSRIHDQSGRNKIVRRQDGGCVAAPIPTDNQREVHQKSDFHRTPKAEQAFKQLKQHLAKLPMLVAPKPKEELIMYLSAFYGAISAVLMTERDAVQKPVYFTSQALQAPELNYTPMEKLVLVLVCAAKRSRRYFQGHLIMVITDQPIKQVISRPDVAGRLQKWSVMLAKHNMTYRPRTSVKGQILADFLVEEPDDAPPEASVIKTLQESWTHGSSLLGEIFSDNGKQFSGDPFKDWCKKLNIVQRFASVKHPQLNRLLERANRSLGKGIKARLGEGNKNWLEELPHVLWAHHTMINSSNNDTSFSLTYRTEAVILAEIGMPTYRTTVADVMHNDEELQQDLDLLEERRERAVIREAKDNLKMTKYYNARVRGVTFRPGDFVYHSNDVSHAIDRGKLGLKWKGPYEVTKALGDGAYKLRSTDGTVLLRTWNIANLKNCYL
nr:reverse transcriptase domain-containing protein [Tanacetum cinerariifolium]